MMKTHAKETQIVHGVHTCHHTSMDLAPPIHMTSTFKFRNVDHGAGIFDGTAEGYVYTRVSNPTIDLLQEKIALLEEGEAALAASSGMSAISAAALSLAGPGDHIVSCATLYGGTFALFDRHLRDLNIHTDFIPPAQANAPTAIAQSLRENTRFLYIETPANPTLDIMDIRMWADAARKHGVPLIVDNTFASPYLQNPMRLGADVVVHSATKYIGGHGDLIAGLIVCSKQTAAKIRDKYALHYGPVMSPFNAWLLLRGIKTLALRMERHSDSALKIAEWLDAHPRVKKVYYPGLPSHPYHQVALKQMKKFGGMISFEVDGGLRDGKIIMDNVRLCILAVSLGDCETLIQHPASMTHSTYSQAQRQAAGIADGLIRLSVGLEAPDDIISDLDGALAKI